MSNKNNVTGDTIITKYSEAYSDNYDAIFRKKKVDEPVSELKSKEIVDGPEFKESVVKMVRLKKLLESPDFLTPY